MTSFSPAGSRTEQNLPSLAVDEATRPFIRQDTFGPLFAAIEITALTLSSVAGGVGYYAFAFPNRSVEFQPLVVVGLIMAALYVALLQPHGYYKLEKLIGNGSGIRRPLLTWVLVFLFFAVFAFTLKIGSDFSRGTMLCFFAIGFVAVGTLRFAVSPVLRRSVARRHLQGRRVVVVGDMRQWAAMGQDAFAAQGCAVLASFHIPVNELDEAALGEQIERSIKDLVVVARHRAVDEIVFALPWSDERLIRRAIEAVRVLPLPVYLVPDTTVGRLLQRPLLTLGSLRAVELQRGPLTNAERGIKRTFDLIVASLGIIALAPLFVAVATLIKLDSRGPVFFRQTRVGFSGRTFRILKFRTMTTLEDGGVVQQATRNDARVTHVGRWLRQSSLDELPQLVNVVLGHMSLVGPRPHALAHDDQYEKLIGTYAYRHHVKPGITGWAQVNGFRGETPSVTLMEQRVEHDLWYISNWSFWLDMRTIMLTVRELIRHRNAY